MGKWGNAMDKHYPRIIFSGDYDALMYHALEVGDKAWFEELAKKKKELIALEEETRQDIGLSE